MDTVVLIAVIAAVRVFIWALLSNIGRRGDWVLFFALVITFFACGIPISLVSQGVLSSTAINALLAGFSLFYFAFVTVRHLNEHRRNRRESG